MCGLSLFSQRDRLFFLDEQLGDDSCHIALIFAVTHLYNVCNFLMISFHSIFYDYMKNLVSRNKLAGLMYQPVCNKGKIVYDVCVGTFCFVFVFGLIL